MTYTSSNIIPSFDFTDALKLSLKDRIGQSIALARETIDERDVQRFFELPMVPDYGASNSELSALEERFGAPIPTEYREFLTRCRYLTLGNGYQIWGFDHKGVTIGLPWISDKHLRGVELLVFGDYWKYADGDQLLIDLSKPNHPVIGYLHEERPLFEHFAPSFSLALWRLVHEFAQSSIDD